MDFHHTLNALPSNARGTVCALLNARVADAIDLALMTKQAHWNLRGPTFFSVHEMLDSLRQELDSHIDTLAERIVQLGGVALGSSQAVATNSQLDAYPDDLTHVEHHLAALVSRYGALANAVREAITTADEAGDAGSADMLTTFSRSLDKALWFLEAHAHHQEEASS